MAETHTRARRHSGFESDSFVTFWRRRGAAVGPSATVGARAHAPRRAQCPVRAVPERSHGVVPPGMASRRRVIRRLRALRARRSRRGARSAKDVDAEESRNAVLSCHHGGGLAQGGAAAASAPAGCGIGAARITRVWSPRASSARAGVVGRWRQAARSQRRAESRRTSAGRATLWVRSPPTPSGTA